MVRRRYTVLIDCEESGFRSGVRFWSEALGARARHSGDPKDPFVELPGAAGDVRVELQRVDAPARRRAGRARASAGVPATAIRSERMTP